MGKSLFQKKLVCSHCNGFFKSRWYRKRRIYICTQADLGQCMRIPIEESFIKDLVCRRMGQGLTDLEVREVLDHVVVRDKWDMEVVFKEGNPMIIKGIHNIY